MENKEIRNCSTCGRASHPKPWLNVCDEVCDESGSRWCSKSDKSSQPKPDKEHNTVTYIPSQFIPEPDKLLVDTVLTVAGSHWVSLENRNRNGCIDIGDELREQDAYTRSEIAKWFLGLPCTHFQTELGESYSIGLTKGQHLALEDSCQKK